MNIIITIAVTAFIVLYSGIFNARKAVIPVALLGLAVALGFNLASFGNDEVFYDMMKVDKFAVAFGTLIIVGTMAILLLTQNYFKSDKNLPEYVTIILFALVGVYMMLSYTNLALLFIGLETMSVSLYILAGIRKSDFASNEASLKYFLMGAFSTGFLLLGFALMYGATGSFDISEIRNQLMNAQQNNSLVYPGVGLILIGMCFKIGAAPFHFWTPDVYEGSPTLITTFMATIVKSAGIAAFLRLFLGALVPMHEYWQPILMVISFITLLLGNVTALYQIHFKRMLAYSSISHAGYLLFAFLVVGNDSLNASLLYLTAYIFASIVAFGTLILVKQHTGSDNFEAYNGLAKKNPFLVFFLTIAMLSMAGIPLTAGFMGKYFMFLNALKEYHFSIVLFAIANALVGFYYYFKVIVAMYFKSATNDTPKISLPLAYSVVFVISTLITIALGIYPNFLVGLF